MNTKTATFYGLLCFESGFTQDKNPKLQPDIHLNLWEHKDNVLLDIGLMLDVHHPSKTIDIFLPWSNDKNTFTDLLNKISNNPAMSAIFNESLLTSSKSGDNGLIVSNTNSKEEQFVVIKAQDAITTRSHDLNSHILSIDIDKLSKNARILSESAERMYIRFRIPNIPKGFYSVGIDKNDKGFSSSWQSTEIIDFRLNVRRGVPAGIESSIGRFLNFRKVHLFLMRSRDHDLVFQDDLFKACRSLEDEDFWADYSLNTNNKNSDELSTAKKMVKDSFGYQWSKKLDSKTNELVKEFSILARFKKMEFTLRKFIFFAILLGALGSASWDGIKFIYSTINSQKSTTSWSNLEFMYSYQLYSKKTSSTFIDGAANDITF